MNYICHSHHSAQNFYVGPCPFPFPIPFPRPLLSAARTPHNKLCTCQISIFRTFVSSHPFLPATHPFSYSLSLPSDAPARQLAIPSDPPVPPSDLDQGDALLLLVIQALVTLRTGPFSLADTSFVKDVIRRHSYVVLSGLLSNLSTPPMQCRSTTYSGRIYTYTVYPDCNILAIIYVISTPSTIFYQSSVHTMPCCLYF